MEKKIKWVPTDHPINKPEKSNIEENFKEEEIKEIEENYSDENEYFVNLILKNQNQPDFWWIY